MPSQEELAANVLLSGELAANALRRVASSGGAELCQDILLLLVQPDKRMRDAAIATVLQPWQRAPGRDAP